MLTFVGGVLFVGDVKVGLATLSSHKTPYKPLNGTLPKLPNRVTPYVAFEVKISY